MKNNFKGIFISQKSRKIVMSMMLIAITFCSAMKVPDDLEAIIVKVETQHNDLYVDVTAPKMCVLKFYIYNTEGGLEKQFYMSGSSRIRVVNLNKGTHIWDVFQGTARLKSGKIDLK